MNQNYGLHTRKFKRRDLPQCNGFICLRFTVPFTIHRQNAQVVTSYWHFINKPISGCVRMACVSLLTTNLLQVFDRLVASSIIVKTCYPQACCKLFQQVVTSLQMTNCNKADFNRIVTT